MRQVVKKRLPVWVKEAINVLPPDVHNWLVTNCHLSIADLNGGDNWKVIIDILNIAGNGPCRY